MPSPFRVPSTRSLVSDFVRRIAVGPRTRPAWLCAARSRIAAPPGGGRLLLCWASLIGLVPFPAAIAAAEPVSAKSSVTLLEFDISAQPLGAALFQYGKATGLPAVYPSELVAGRRSSAVRGTYTSEVALSRMLQGTGLVAEKVATSYGNIFRLDRPGQTVAHMPDPARGRSRLDGYPAQVQSGVLDALCADPVTVPGSYAALLRIQVDASGQARHAELVESTGDRARDTALVAALRQLRTRPPPADRASVSYVISLLPASPGKRRPCGTLRVAAP